MTKYLHFDNISLNSSQNEKYFKQNCRENHDTHFMFNNIFPKIMSFRRQCGRILYSRTGHRWKYGACALHAEYL